MNSVPVTTAVNIDSIPPHQIEQWILQSNDPTNRSMQHHAIQSLQQYINSTNYVTAIIATLFHVLHDTTNPISQFYVLSTLQRRPYFHSLSNVQRVQLRTYLLETIAFRSGSTSSQTPTFVRNKAAAILSTFLIQDTSINAMKNRSGNITGSATGSDGSYPLGVRNWCSVTNDMISIAQQNPEYYLQTVIYVLDDIMMSTTSSSDDDQHDNSGGTVVTPEDIRQFKDILKGYINDDDDDDSNQRPNSSSQNSTTLLQFMFELVIQIYNLTFHKNNHHSNGSTTTMDDPDGAIILLCIKAITNIFTWTTIEFLGSSVVLSQMFQLMIYTVQRYNAAVAHSPIRYDIMKAIFVGWKEFVTSCNMSPPPSLSKTTASNKPHTDTELASSIQSLSDPKLSIIRHIVDCINSTQFLPPCDTIASSVPSTPNLVLVSPDNTDDSSVSSDMMEVIIQMSTLINNIGLEIIPLYEQEVLAGKATMERNESLLENLFQQVYDLSIRAFSYDDIDVSTEILPLFIRLSYYMEEEQNRNGMSNDNVSRSMIHQLPFILNILYQQMKYPTDFSYGNDDYDVDDDEDAEEILFRTELCHVYKKLITAAPTVCLKFVSDVFFSLASKTPVSNNISISLDLAAVPTPDIEAILRLLYVFCEAIRPSPGLKVVMQNEAFCNIIQTLHQSNIIQHPHREVLCLYYETAVRYYPFYLSSGQNDLLSKLLNAMTSISGLQHPHPHVRSRCCYLFLRLVQVAIALLTPYVETAVAGILSLLTNPLLVLRGDDTMYLFETIGLLLGKTGLEAKLQKQYLTAVISPHVRNIESTLTTINQNLCSSSSPTLPETESDDTLTNNYEILTSCITAITSLSKGFTKPSHEIAIVLTETLHITLIVLQTLPSNEHIRNKSMVLLQRMVVCVGQNVLDIIPPFLQILVDWSTCDDILFVAQIFNQLCIKFKQSTIPAIDAAILPFLEKCQTLVPTLRDNVADTIDTVLPPHLETEQLAIRKLSYIVLQHVVTHQVTGVLFSTNNVGHLETVLRLMYDGIINAPDPIAKKTCLRFFRALIEQIKTLPTTNVLTDGTNMGHLFGHGILAFLGETVIPNTFQLVLKSPNRQQYVNDANGVRVVTEFCQLLWTFRDVCGVEMGHEIMYQNCLNTLKMQCPQSPNIDIYNLQQHLQQASSANEFVICIQNIVKESIKK